VYDANGKLVRKLQNKDIKDIKPYEQFVNDYRAKEVEFPKLALPYTVEYTVVTQHKGLMYYPIFSPQGDYGVAVQHASYKVELPPGIKLKVKELSLPDQAKKADLHWEINELPAVRKAAFMPERGHQFPSVLCCPSTFMIDGYEGSFDSWQSFGTFIGKLNEGRDQLPAETISKVKALVADCPDERCKLERVYAYLQENTRYFFVGLGLGGWQPMPAMEVDKFKYSDCKGLSNYMVAMLKAIGLEAYYVLIRAGSDEIDQQYPDFPNPYFNHATACAIIGQDTIWLECTSQTESCGFNSDFTDERLALLITEEGGKLVQTPRYSAEQNKVLRQTNISITPEGNANISSTNTFKCIQQVMFSHFENLHQEQWKKLLYENLGLSDFEIKSLEISRKKGQLPEATQKMELHAPRFASLSGKRIFVPMTALSRKIELPEIEPERQHPIQITSRSNTEEDHITIAMPEGFNLENVVGTERFDSPFGSYERSIKLEGRTIMVHRKLVLDNSVQPKERFDVFLDFLKNISKADKGKLVLVKGT
jgi:hypothetical protein